jgi:hypothetical protein
MNQENPTYHYGLSSKVQAIVLATEVCDVLGHGANKRAVNLLLETAAAETCLGTYKDTTPGSAGMGLCQIDHIGFIDIQQRTRPNIVKRIKNEWGYNILDAKHIDLANDPKLSFIFCRLHYRLRPEEIPLSMRGRAEYWKQFYNSLAGKGTVAHYLANASGYLYRLTPEELGRAL